MMRILPVPPVDVGFHSLRELWLENFPEEPPDESELPWLLGEVQSPDEIAGGEIGG